MIHCDKMQRAAWQIGLALAAVLVLGPAARADYVDAKVTDLGPGGETFSFVFNGSHETGYAMAIHWAVTGGNSGLPTNFTTFCDDLSQTVTFGGGPYKFQIVDPKYTPDDKPLVPTPTTTTGMGAAKAKLVREFWGTFISQVNSPETEAAFQIGIWDIVNNGGLTLKSGNFKADSNVYGSDPTKWPSFLQTAQDWLTQLKSGKGLGYEADLVGLQSATDQDQLTTVPAPPSLMLMGVGALGLVLNGWRRRRACNA